MSAGTLTLVNGSDQIVGVGTTFTTEMKVGDYIFCKVNGTPYTMPVKSITTDTDCVITVAYSGPVATDVPWEFVPQEIMSFVSAALAVQASEALRQLNNDKDNWLQVFSSTAEEITVRIGNGLTFTGPSWLYLKNLMNTLDIDDLTVLANQIHQDVATNEQIKDDIAADAAQVTADKTAVVNDAAQVAEDRIAVENAKNAAAQSEANAEQYKEDAAESAAAAAESNPANYLMKESNLQDLADRAAAWLNVRPIGSTPLAADPVSAYDAATKRWVENLISAGTTGPTMNGVMNYHIGEAVQWETRAYYPPNCLPRDGQLVNRADWPELWAWAQKTTPITDAAWLADVTKRGSYSTGNGTTTFRLPDWNGVQSGSIPGVFFRGGAGAADMIMALNAAPDIQFTYNPLFPGVTQVPADSYSGAAEPMSVEPAFTNPGGGVVSSNFQRGLRVKASTFNAAYGRNGATEVVPNKVSGVWLVRASGGFVAANTSWSVINKDSTTPGAGVLVKGGTIQSTYDAPGLSVKARFEVTHNTTEQTTGVTRASLSVTDKNGVTKNADLDSLGNFGIPNSFIGASILTNPPNDVALYNSFKRDIIGGSTRFGGAIELRFNRIPAGYDFYPQQDSNGTVHVFERVFDGNGNVAATFAKHNDGSYTAYNGSFVNGSDVRIKDNIATIEDPLEKMKLFHGCTWNLKASGNFGIGFIAQEVEKVFPEAVHTGNYAQELPDGTTVENVKALSAGDVAAALHHEAILALMAEIEAMKAEIKELKSR